MESNALVIALAVLWLCLFAFIIYLVRRWLLSRKGKETVSPAPPKQKPATPILPPRPVMTATTLKQISHLRRSIDKRWTKVMLGLQYHGAKEPDRYVAIIESWMKEK